MQLQLYILNTTGRCTASSRAACFRKAALSAYTGRDELTRHTEGFYGERQTRHVRVSISINSAPAWISAFVPGNGIPAREGTEHITGRHGSSSAYTSLIQCTLLTKSCGIPPPALRLVLLGTEGQEMLHG